MYWELLPGAEGCKRPREISLDQNRTDFIDRNLTSAVPALMTRHLEVGYSDFLQSDPDCVRACRAVLTRHSLTQARVAIERKRKTELMSPELRAVRALLVDTGSPVLRIHPACHALSLR